MTAGRRAVLTGRQDGRTCLRRSGRCRSPTASWHATVDSTLRESADHEGAAPAEPRRAHMLQRCEGGYSLEVGHGRGRGANWTVLMRLVVPSSGRLESPAHARWPSGHATRRCMRVRQGRARRPAPRAEASAKVHLPPHFSQVKRYTTTRPTAPRRWRSSL